MTKHEEVAKEILEELCIAGFPDKVATILRKQFPQETEELESRFCETLNYLFGYRQDNISFAIPFDRARAIIGGRVNDEIKKRGLVLASFLARQIEWSTRTFGAGRRTLGILKHIEKEIAETKAKPEDLTEWIDIMILAIDGYWRHGGRPETIMRDLVAKAEINYQRVYPMPTSEDEPSEHVRA